MPAEQRRLLLQVARQAVEMGPLPDRQAGRIGVADSDQLPDVLRRIQAAFVTLNLRSDGSLRGCIGSLQATRPLIDEVAGNAHLAAYGDPRFPPVDEAEFPRLHIEISLISPLAEFKAAAREGLIEWLAGQPLNERPGLVLQEQSLNRSATFLPAVWVQLPDAEAFVGELLRKAGLPVDHWSDAMRVQTYTAEEFAEPTAPG